MNKYNWPVLDAVLKKEGKRKTIRMLAELTGVPEFRIRARCKKLDIQPPSPRDLKINHIYLNPESKPRQLAKEFNCNAAYISFVRRRAMAGADFKKEKQTV